MKQMSLGLQTLVGMLEAARRIDDTGKVSFSGAEFSEYADLLVSIIEPSVRISEIEKYRLTRRAIFHAGAKGPLTIGSLKNEVDNAIRDFLAQPFKKYRIITTISIVGQLLAGSIRFKDCKIIFPRKLKNSVRLARESVVSKACKSLGYSSDDSYSLVDVHVSARTESDAVDIALVSLNTVRAIWNFSMNIDSGRTYYTGKRKPVNKILLGPIHTVHSEDGHLASESWWYDECFTIISPIRDARHVKHMRSVYSIISRKLKRSALGDDLLGSLLRYSNSLDYIDCGSILLKLWGEIEFLTNGRHVKYDTVIHRCSFIYKDRDFAKLTLQEIRKHRNFYAHEGKDAQFLNEHFVHVTRGYVEQMLRFLIVHNRIFECFDDIGQLLDLPGNIQLIGKRKTLLTRAQRLLLNFE